MDPRVVYLLQHPLVLKSAWQKITSWYHFGEWPPLAEFARWRADPLSQLISLSRSLVDGSYEPSKFKMFPYPKKGGMVRHYTQPSVRDQVAFAVFGVLLAPALESRMPNFSFGNRWYRRSYRRLVTDSQPRLQQLNLFAREHTSSPRPVWALRPFSPNDKPIYQPYTRSHGLFRRVAHWAATSLLDVAATDTTATDRPKEKEDYAPESLPPFVHGSWWKAPQARQGRGYWTHLDLQLAYPSLRLDRLRLLMKSALAEGSSFESERELIAFGVEDKAKALERAYVGYPVDIGVRLKDPQVRLELAELLLGSLSRIRFEPLPFRDSTLRNGAWLPPHAHQYLPLDDGANQKSLPTGLAISGLLMNVALTGLDTIMADWMMSVAEGAKGSAFLRFADDMILLSSDMEILAQGIDRIWEGLSLLPSDPTVSNPVTTIPKPKGLDSNLRVSWSKVEPEPLSSLLQLYLEDEGWTRCLGCGLVLIPPLNSSVGSARFADWFRERHLSWKAGARDPKTEKFNDSFRRMEESAIRSDRLQPFVTYLVERLSALGQDTLRERFGPELQDRLTQLHELVRFDLQDKQVREDTRLAFAVNRLVKAWLSEDDPSLQRSQITQIRRSIQVAIFKAPWKFSLWLSVVRAAVRRPLSGANADDERQAREWLQDLLVSISFGQEQGLIFGEDHGETLDWAEDKSTSACWNDHQLKGVQDADIQEMFRARRQIVLSYLRTAFWNALREAMEELFALNSRLTSEQDEASVLDWSSASWTFRSLSESAIPEALNWLRKLDVWAKILYPRKHRKDINRSLQNWWWEHDAVKGVLLSCTNKDNILHEVLRDSEQLPDPHDPLPNEHIEIPRDLLARLDIPGSKSLKSIAVSALPKSTMFNRFDPWLLLLLGGRESYNVSALMEPLERLLELGDLSHPLVSRAIKLGRALGVLDQVSPESIGRLFQSITDNPLWWAGKDSAIGKFQALETYSEIRNLFLSLPPRSLSNSSAGGVITLHGLLWRGNKDALCELRARLPLAPALVPAVGLPSRIALAMLQDAILDVSALLADPLGCQDKVAVSSAPIPGVWVLLPESLETALIGRQLQLDLQTPSYHDLNRAAPSRWIRVSRDRRDWEILPHPAFFYPWIMGLPSDAEPIFQLWCHMLFFYTAITGSEYFLEAIFHHGIGAVPFSERWDLRGQIPVPAEIWEAVEQFFALCGLRAADSSTSADLVDIIARVRGSLARVLSDPLPSIHDFRWERVDVRLELERGLEIPEAVLPFTFEHPHGPYRKSFIIHSEHLSDSLTVRIGQVRAHPNWEAAPSRFPGLRRDEIQEVMREIWAVLYSENQGVGSRYTSANLVLLPEVCIPRSEIRSIKVVAARQGFGVFGGLYWRVIPNAVRPHRLARDGKRLIVNEALLAIPLRFQGDSGPPLIRSFFIEKPVPATIEQGLALSLSEMGRAGSTQWAVLRGRRWYRFVHPLWGDFSLAVCSDLLDASPWVSLRGSILHLFMCAYNKDVELYEALTWVRAYENYANVVSVNHGHHGGSFVWSPKHGGRKEIARMRGENLFVFADVVLPVKSLYRAQRERLSWALTQDTARWSSSDGSSKVEDELREFKSPPPDFPGDRRGSDR